MDNNKGDDHEKCYQWNEKRNAIATGVLQQLDFASQSWSYRLKESLVARRERKMKKGGGWKRRKGKLVGVSCRAFKASYSDVGRITE